MCINGRGEGGGDRDRENGLKDGWREGARGWMDGWMDLLTGQAELADRTLGQYCQLSFLPPILFLLCQFARCCLQENNRENRETF